MTELFYNFCFDEANKGYYYLKQTDDELLSKTRFYLETGELYTNIFELKLDDDKVSAYRHQEGSWVDFSFRSDKHFPTSAYPLLLSKALLKPYRYVAVSEHDGSILGEAVLTLDNGEIVEKVEGKLSRCFVMQGDTPTQIHWGGPVSHLCKTPEEAVKNSSLAFTY